MSSIFVLVNGVLGIQKALSRSDVYVNVDPILRRTVSQFFHTIGQEPFMDEVESFLRGCNKIMNFFDCEMLAISWVGGIRDC